MIKIANAITGLERGGAEAMVCKVVRVLPVDRYASKVVSLTNEGALGHVIRQPTARSTSWDEARGARSLEY